MQEKKTVFGQRRCEWSAGLLSLVGNRTAIGARLCKTRLGERMDCAVLVKWSRLSTWKRAESRRRGFEKGGERRCGCASGSPVRRQMTPSTDAGLGFGPTSWPQSPKIGESRMSCRCMGSGRLASRSRLPSDFTRLETGGKETGNSQGRAL
jgi:hypothetical protein